MLLHLLICTALRAHIFVVQVLYKVNYYYRWIPETSTGTNHEAALYNYAFTRHEIAAKRGRKENIVPLDLLAWTTSATLQSHRSAGALWFLTQVVKSTTRLSWPGAPSAGKFSTETKTGFNPRKKIWMANGVDIQNWHWRPKEVTAWC